MKISVLNKATAIAFLLIPVLAEIRLVYHAPYLNYGYGEITVNSILLLIFAIYVLFVSISRLIQTYHCWKKGDDKWKRKLINAYIFVFIFVLSLSFLLILINGGSHLGEFLLCLCFISSVFCFPIGIILFFLSCAGLRYLKIRPKSYLILIFCSSALFIIVGAIPTAIVFYWWINGGLPR
jgi:hypothetical protein